MDLVEVVAPETRELGVNGLVESPDTKFASNVGEFVMELQQGFVPYAKLIGDGPGKRLFQEKQLLDTLPQITHRQVTGATMRRSYIKVRVLEIMPLYRLLTKECDAMTVKYERS